jgi:hypothetical protein
MMLAPIKQSTTKADGEKTPKAAPSEEELNAPAAVAVEADAQVSE